MCDLSPVRNWLLAMLAAILAAVAIIVGAAIANGSFFVAWTAPAGMLAAAAATGLAILFCGLAASALDVFCNCAGASCAGPCGNLKDVLNAVRVMLGIQATACLAAALIAWIPVAGQPLMWIIAGALLIQAALIIRPLSLCRSCRRVNCLPLVHCHRRSLRPRRGEATQNPLGTVAPRLGQRPADLWQESSLSMMTQ